MPSDMIASEIGTLVLITFISLVQQSLAQDIFPDIGCSPEVNSKFASEAFSKCDSATFHDPTLPEVDYDKSIPSKVPKFGMYCKKACILNQLGFVDVHGKRKVSEGVPGKPATWTVTGYWMNTANLERGIEIQVGAVHYVPDWKMKDAKIKSIYEMAEAASASVSSCETWLQISFQVFGPSCKGWAKFYECVENQLKEVKLCQMVKDREENVKYIEEFAKTIALAKLVYPNIGCGAQTNLKFSEQAYHKCQKATFHIPNLPEIDDGNFPEFGIYCQKACILSQLGFLQVAGKTIIAESMENYPATAIPKGYWMSPDDVFVGMCWQVGAAQYRPDLKGKDARIKEIYEKAEMATMELGSCLVHLYNEFREYRASCEYWEIFYDCVEVALKISDLCEMVEKREENRKYIREFLKHQ